SCYEDYIAEFGDYYSVKNCRCHDPCEAAAYTARMSEANWPAGGFIYGGFCPKARSLNFSDCAEFYRENSATIEVSFGQLGYQLMKQSSRVTASDVIKSMAGDTGLWIRFTAVSVGELVLILAQLLLWICTKTTELPEVPSCRRRNYAFTGRDDSEQDDDVTTSPQ
ncbi:degenerin unc-8, partial [Aphelenchoides avenae]